MAFSTLDTIVAIATPHGRGGIGVVRVAGPDAVSIILATTGLHALEPRHATFARLVSPDDLGVVDQVVVTWFQAPHSYTGDDVVEVSGHGSPWVLQRIVDLACGQGARLAEPGEFTFRAYLNGRIDLVQAEAVADLINAVTPLQARVAMDQLEGTLTRRIAAIDAAVFDVVAKLEASLDFPDEGFHFISRAEARAGLAAACADIGRLIADGRRGRLVREGRLVVIAGRPNVGKSSLFNALVGAGRAIVTPLAGTTRDVLTEVVDINGVPITLVDTAGVREALDEIEAEGVRRAHDAVQIAALTLVVLDGSTPLTEDDEKLLAAITSPSILVVNKSDQPRVWSRVQGPGSRVLEVSAKTGAGLEPLREAIVHSLAGVEEWRDTPAVSNQRHLQCAEVAHAAVERAMAAAEAGATEEIVLAELTDAREALETLTGRRTPDDVLAHIFSHFCIGK
ncbi:MAG: tRNA uridine-5-carboxymethylaminomethyl(34) synthesis GTPase MnmE [Acidimicrobiia bacterium]|nr:tRNA uridine-5-carboxymethylaminomethyl(34) synthesis GTPase MnmE [Acidimicrobiia bacterium]